MFHSKERFYFFIGLGCVIGYGWIYMHISTLLSKYVGSVCVIKKISGMPCPSCGSTRAILALLHGEWAQAIAWNPIGLFLLGGLMVIPSWLFFDLFSKSSSFFDTYLSVEQKLKNKRILILLLLLIGMNWIWNIYKGL
jgi:hypothetical protein